MKIYTLFGLTLSLTLLFCTVVTSQVTFQKTFGASGNDGANWVANTATGYVVAGYTTSIDGDHNGYLLNLDFSGNVIWQKSTGGDQNDVFNVVLPATDGFMVLGETESFGSTGSEAWLLKFNTDGSMAWAKTLGDTSAVETATSMTAVSDNRYLLGGSQNAGGNSYAWFTLVDSAGNTLWTKTYESIETGNTLRSNYVDNGVIYAGGIVETQAGMAKIDLETGNFLGAVQYYGDGAGALYYIQPTADSSLMLADHTVVDSSGVTKQWVNKVTLDGQTLWSKVYTRGSGNLRGRIEDAGNDTYLLTPYDGSAPADGDALLAKIDNQGNVLWSRNYGRPGADWLWKSQLAADAGFVSVGVAAGANGDQDVLVIKTDADGLVDGCCIRPGDITADAYEVSDSTESLSPLDWASTADLPLQPDDANLQSADYCNSTPVEITNEISLCPSVIFTVDSVDYSAPAEFDVTLSGATGCDTIVHYNLIALPQVTETENVALCPGDSVTINGVVYTESDTVVITFANADPNACDTVLTYIIQVSQPVLTDSISFCAGDSVTINGVVYTEAGTVTDTIPGASGACDTLLTYTLSLLPNPVQTDSISFCSGDSITINGVVYTQPGTVSDTISVAGACDTIVNYVLSFLPTPVQTDSISFCAGDSVTINGVVYTQEGTVSDTISVAGACDTIITYVLSLLPQPTQSEAISFCEGDSVTINGQVYTQSGTVTDVIASTTGGCDTLVTYTLTVLSAPTLSESISFCDSVTINGQVYTQSGTVTETLASTTGGCDTVVTYTLTQVTEQTSAQSISFCEGGSVTIGGVVYTQSGTVIDTIQSTTSCDTIVTYTLTVLTQAVVNEAVSFCEGDSVTIDGQVYTESGVVTVTIPGGVGACDSLITYTITVSPQPLISESISFCQGDTITIDGVAYTQTTIVVDTLASSTGGCDTIITYSLTMITTPIVNDTVSFCAGDSVTINGVVYTDSGIVSDTIASTGGACDTIINYILTLLPQPTQSESLSFCGSVTIGGVVYTQSGTVVDTVAATTGCDTIVTYTLTLLPQPTTKDTIVLCAGDSVVINGQTYTEAAIVTDTIPGVGGCDTIATYVIQEVLPFVSNLTLTCPIDITIIADPGTAPVVVDYDAPTVTSDCPCPTSTLTQTVGLPSGAAFPNGVNQVCYSAQDGCGSTKTCCFTVTIREVQPCDVKVNGCMRYELLEITSNATNRRTYRIRVVNNCANKLIYTAIQLPNGVVADAPANLSVFTTEDGRKYDVRNPNFSPFYSIRFKSTTDSIASGQSDVFEYTLPAQAQPTFINITSRLAPQVYYEAHLNTFNCPIVYSKPAGDQDDRGEEVEVFGQSKLTLFPNPTDGTIYVDLAGWSGKNATWRILNTQGQEVMVNADLTNEGVVRIDMAQVLYSGLFFFEIVGEDGTRETARFVYQR